MTNLALIVDQIKSEITIDSDGRGKASIRAVSRLMDIADSSLIRTFNGAAQNPSNLAEILAGHGFDAAAQNQFSEQGVPDIAIAVIAKYYAYKAGRYCKKQAELVDTAFTAIGVRAWMQDAVGWEKQQAPMTPIQALSLVVQQMAEQERRILEQQREIEVTNARLEAVECEQGRYIAPAGNKYTVLGFAIKQGIELSASAAGQKGRKASAACRKQGVDIERIYDPRFGHVGLYPESVLIEVFK